jgi:hypothetical protein
MSSGDDFDFAQARQTYGAIRLGSMPELPAYAACVAVACRVGRAISAHASEMPWNKTSQLSTAQAIQYASPNIALNLPPLPEQSSLPLEKYPPSNSEEFFARVLKAYRFAADASQTIPIERHAEMGRTRRTLKGENSNNQTSLGFQLAAVYGLAFTLCLILIAAAHWQTP